MLFVNSLSHTRENLVDFFSLQDDIEIVGEAATGENALRIIETALPDLVIMDADLPDMDGFEVTRRMVAMQPGLTVILLTVHSSEKDVQIAQAAGAAACIEKSAGLEALIEAIQSVTID